VRPQAVLATSKDRLEVERMARTASLERERAALGAQGFDTVAFAGLRAASLRAEPIKPDARAAALKAVDDELAKAGLIDRETGRPSEKIVAELSWQREEWLPTPGLLVKGCLDRRTTCEPALEEQIALELEHQRLKNQLLERQVQLLDKAHEYRCCPAGESEEEPDEE
jgi:hypothetical protein